MKYITKLMINKYQMKEFDFMGYTFQESNASYHHMIIPKRHGGPATIANGAILNSQTSHPYLHTIETRDMDRFCAITSELIDENIKGHLDKENIRRIHDVLESFEREYSGRTNRKGKQIIKEIYTVRHKI